MSVLSVAARDAVRQALFKGPSTLSPVNVQARCLTLSASSLANTDLRNIGRDPRLQSRLDVNNTDHQQASKSDYRHQEECSADDKLWRWIPNVTEKKNKKTSKTGESTNSSPDAMSDQDRLSATLREDDPLQAERNMHPDGAPDAQQFNESPELSPEYKKIRSQIDYANYPGPKRLSSLKETVQDELDAAKGKFEEVKDDLKETVGRLPDKARRLEDKIEERGARLADKIKGFVHRDKKSD